MAKDNNTLQSLRQAGVCMATAYKKTYLVIENPAKLDIPGSFSEVVHSNCGEVPVIKIRVDLVKKLN